MKRFQRSSTESKRRKQGQRRRRSLAAPAFERLEERNLLAADAATWQETSAYLIGDVAVKVVGFESDGSGADPNLTDFTDAFKADVKDSVNAAANWLVEAMALRTDRHELNFDIDFSLLDNPVNTPYEPNLHSPSAPNGALFPMIDHFLEQVDQTNEDTVRNNMLRFLDSHRDQKGADWSFLLFVTPQHFKNTSGAFAAYSGPYAVVSGASALRPAIVAHEMLHVFGGVDEYKGGTPYGFTAGYLGVDCTDCLNRHPNPEDVPIGIMASTGPVVWDGHLMTPSTIAHIGWRDSDGDGVFDILDVPLELEGTGSQSASQFTFEGFANAGAYPNNYSHSTYNSDITINTIDVLEYRLDNTDWVEAANYADSNSANVALSVDVDGAETIEVRVRDRDTDMVSNALAFDLDADGTVRSPQVHVENITATSATLVWSGSGPATDGFHVIPHGLPSVKVGPETRSYELTGLMPGASYTYSVMAYADPNYAQRAWGQVQFTTLEETEPPPVDPPPADAPSVRYRVETRSLDGQPIQVVEEETPFEVYVYVDDTSSAGRGVFSAFVDLTATAGAEIDHDSIVFGSTFSEYTEVDWNAADALVGDAGGFGGVDAPGGDEQLLFRVRASVRPGVDAVQWGLNAADDSPYTATLVYGYESAVDADAIEYVGAQLLVSSIQRYDIDGDELITPIDALRVINWLRDEARQYDRRLDVNRDGRINVQDALMEINEVRRAFLDRRGSSSSAEGESSFWGAEQPLPTIWDDDAVGWRARHDRVFESDSLWTDSKE